MKKVWTPTQDAFRQFLDWLDEGADSAGERYLEMRHRLILYFDRKNCLSPDELADETLNRVAQRYQEKGAITDKSPPHFCYIVAKFVFLEYLRRAKRGQTSFDELALSGNRQPDVPALAREESAIEGREKLLDRLERCLNNLSAEDRALILEYYQGEGRTKIDSRRRQAERLGLSPNALSIRACRIRSKVEACVRTSTGNT